MLTRGGELGSGQGGRFIKAAQDHATRLGYRLVPFHIDFEKSSLESAPDEAGRYVDLKNIDSAIVYSRHYTEADILNLAARMPVSAVISYDLYAANVYSFYIDYAANISLAINHLLDLGIKDYAMLRLISGGIVPFHSRLMRWFNTAAMIAGKRIRSHIGMDWRSDISQGEDFYQQWVSAAHRPQAVISHVNYPLEEFQRSLTKHGVPLEEQPRMVCLSDLRDIPTKNMAYFDIDIESMAMQAVTAIHNNMTGAGETYLNKPFFGTLNTRLCID